MPKTIIVSGFPGIGKSTLSQEAGRFGSILDLDSAAFNWCPGAPSCRPGTYKKYRNPEGAKDYGASILQHYNSGEYDYIFVSTHADTRKFLHDNKIPFILVYPDISRKKEFEQHYRERGSPEGMIKFVIGNWDMLIDGLNHDLYSNKKIKMDDNKYLANYKDDLNLGHTHDDDDGDDGDEMDWEGGGTSYTKNKRKRINGRKTKKRRRKKRRRKKRRRKKRRRKKTKRHRRKKKKRRTRHKY